MKPKYRDVKEFFNLHLKHVNFDISLINKLKNFRLKWSTKDDEYIEFLGSNLVGVHMIRFSSIDDKNLMEIYGITNIDKLQKEFYLVDGIDKKFKIGSNVIYHTLVYTAHRYLTSNVLDDKYKKAGLREACLLLQYRMFSSLYSHYFKYKVDKNTAATVYERLSYKYLIKQKDTWQDTFEYRVETCLDKDNPNYKRLIRYTTEDAVRVVTDIQTKLRSGLISIYKILVEVVNDKNKLAIEDTTFVGGEKNEKQVRDLTNTRNLIVYVESFVYKPEEFIDRDLVTVVDKLFSNINTDDIYKFLKCMTDEKRNPPKKFFKVIEKLIQVNIEYIQRQGININDRSNIPLILIKTKYYWSSSKVKNKDMDFVKRYLQKKVKECTGRNSSWLMSALANAYVCYITLRMFKNT